jgi:hypothetical protein
MVPSVWRCVDSDCASLRQQWQRAGTAGRLPAEQRFHSCSNERSRSHRLRAEEVRGRGRMVRRRGLSVRAVTSRAGSDVLAGCVAVQREPRSHSVGKVAEELRSTYPASVWASKAIPWLH